MPSTAISAVSLPVANMERSLYFYTTVLAFHQIADHEVASEALDCLYQLSQVRLRVVQLQLGDETIELIEFLTPKGRPIPPDARSHDHWFQHLAIVVSDLPKAHRHLRHYEVEQTSSAPQTLPDTNPVAGGIQALYCKDPDGHNLELIHFPPDKGQPKWQQATDALFLGIDHTAIVVADTAASRAFYCHQLGLKLQQESHNLGIEQARLSGVANAQVEVSRLTAPSGLGLELLEYVQPRDGRPMPLDTQVNDLWCWQTSIGVEDMATKIQQLAAQVTLISSWPGPDLAPPSFLIKDVTGHVIRLVSQAKSPS